MRDHKRFEFILYLLATLLGFSVSVEVECTIEIEQAGTTLTLRGSYCFTDVDSGTPLAEVEIPERFIASLSPQTTSLTVSNDGILLVQDWYTEVRGVVLEDPKNDPRIYDQDGDEKIGDDRKGRHPRYRRRGEVHRKPDPLSPRRTRDRSGHDSRADRVVQRGSDARRVEPALRRRDIGTAIPCPTRYRFILKRVDESFDCSARSFSNSYASPSPTLAGRISGKGG